MNWDFQKRMFRTAKNGEDKFLEGDKTIVLWIKSKEKIMIINNNKKKS